MITPVTKMNPLLNNHDSQEYLLIQRRLQYLHELNLYPKNNDDPFTDSTLMELEDVFSLGKVIQQIEQIEEPINE